MHEEIVLISHDTIGDQMAGPGIRYSNIAKALARHMNLVLAIPSQSPAWQDEQMAQPRVARYTHGQWETLQPLVAGSRVIICPPDTLSDFPQLAAGEWCLAIDDYDPLLSEWLAAASMSDWAWQSVGWRHRMNTMLPHWLHGDFFFCASERQRDWMLGILEAMGRLNPHTYAEDHSLRRLVDVVSTGLPPDPPQHTRNVFRDVWPGINADDVLALWGGGLWPWLDPLTAIRAVHAAHKQIPNLKLLFPGTRLPNPTMSGIRTLLPEAQALVKSLDMENAVFFGDWMPYGDWPNALIEADVALTLHIDSLETRLAFRSRVLDYIWAGLPTIATAGDATSDLVRKYGLGAVVPQQDADAVAGAIIELAQAGRPLPGSDVDRARRELSWDVVIQPLLHFCKHPRKAPDKIAWPGRIGPPLFVEKASEMEYWKSVSEAYANGKFIRFMRWLRTGGKDKQ